MLRTKTTKSEMLDNLRVMLRDVFQLRTNGAAYARLARAHGYIDGYMRVLLETGLADRRELLTLVAAERERVSGPGTRELETNAFAVA
jgi:hypothetical protein